MLQSEFFERTKVNLTGEEYVKVETLYSEVEMNKDDFCKNWLKLRNNPLMKEIVEAFYKSQQMVYEISRLKAQLREKDKVRMEDLDKQAKEYNNKFVSFAEKIIRANEAGELRVYDVIEEECGLPFIIRTKHEAEIPLSDEEIRYMVSKL